MARTSIDHWLNSKNHPFFKNRSGTRLAIIGDLRIFVQFPTDTMTNKFSNHRKTCTFSNPLYCSRDVRKMRPRTDLFQTNIKRSFGYIDEALLFCADLPNGRVIAASP